MSIHDLTSRERQLSAAASTQLGFRTILFRDGHWICQPYGTPEMGFGDTPEASVADCRENNKLRPMTDDEAKALQGLHARQPGPFV